MALVGGVLMFMVRRTPAALYAFWLAAIALLSAGCSHVAPTTETDPAELDSEYVAADEEPSDDEDLKRDEADIGSSGPDQIEEAIEALDAQTEGRPALVSELHAATGAAHAGGDVFERIRTGFTLTDVDHESIERELSWF